MPKIIPEDYICPITGLIMRDPVLASDEQHYERDAIQKHILMNGKHSPLTRADIKDEFIADRRLRNQITQFLDENPELYKEKEVYVPKSVWTTLHEAITHGKIKLVKTLVEKEPFLLTMSPKQAAEQGLTIFAPNDQPSELTCLHLASRDYSFELCQLIRDLIGEEKYQQIRQQANWDPVMLNHAYGRAVEDGNVEIAKELIELGTSGDYAFQYAAWNNQLTLMNFLLLQNLVPKDPKFIFQQIAALIPTGNNNLIQVLVQLNPHCLTLTDAFHNTLLDLALRDVNLELAKFLMSKHAFNFQKESGINNRPLHSLIYAFSSGKGNFEEVSAFVKLLLQAESSVQGRPNIDCLSLCVTRQCMALLPLLLESVDVVSSDILRLCKDKVTFDLLSAKSEKLKSSAINQSSYLQLMVYALEANMLEIDDEYQGYMLLVAAIVSYLHKENIVTLNALEKLLQLGAKITPNLFIQMLYHRIDRAGNTLHYWVRAQGFEKLIAEGFHVSALRVALVSHSIYDDKNKLQVELVELLFKYGAKLDFEFPKHLTQSERDTLVALHKKNNPEPQVNRSGFFFHQGEVRDDRKIATAFTREALERASKFESEFKAANGI